MLIKVKELQGSMDTTTPKNSGKTDILLQGDYKKCDEKVIRNSSLPLLGGRKMTRQDKEKHSIF